MEQEQETCAMGRATTVTYVAGARLSQLRRSLWQSRKELRGYA